MILKDLRGNRSDQTTSVVVLQDGELVVDTPIVTGDPTKGRATRRAPERYGPEKRNAICRAKATALTSTIGCRSTGPVSACTTPRGDPVSADGFTGEAEATAVSICLSLRRKHCTRIPLSTLLWSSIRAKRLLSRSRAHRICEIRNDKPPFCGRAREVCCVAEKAIESMRAEKICGRLPGKVCFVSAIELYCLGLCAIFMEKSKDGDGDE